MFEDSYYYLWVTVRKVTFKTYVSSNYHSNCNMFDKDLNRLILLDYLNILEYLAYSFV